MPKTNEPTKKGPTGGSSGTSNQLSGVTPPDFGLSEKEVKKRCKNDEATAHLRDSKRSDWCWDYCKGLHEAGMFPKWYTQHKLSKNETESHAIVCKLYPKDCKEHKTFMECKAELGRGVNSGYFHELYSSKNFIWHKYRYMLCSFGVMVFFGIAILLFFIFCYSETKDRSGGKKRNFKSKSTKKSVKKSGVKSGKSKGGKSKGGKSSKNMKLLGSKSKRSGKTKSGKSKSSKSKKSLKK